MIDHKNHYARYCELISLAASSAPARQRDGGYMAAVYILSADKTLTLDIITQAMYIWKCGCTIFAGQDGSIQLDRTGECQRRGIEQALSQHLSEFE